jgi:Holliday junction resolvase RusA-like endonuclease
MDHSRIQPGPARRIQFEVPGTPAQQGSKTLGQTKEGKTFMRESAKGLAVWRGKVIAHARAAIGPRWKPLDGPLYLYLTFWMPRPDSHPKTIATYPTGAPDLDKLVRAIGDSLTQANVIVDDARIVKLATSEWYAGPPLHPDAKPGVAINVGMLA